MSLEVIASSSSDQKLLPHHHVAGNYHLTFVDSAESTQCHEQLHLKMNLAVHYLFQCWSKYRDFAPVVHKMICIFLNLHVLDNHQVYSAL